MAWISTETLYWFQYVNITVRLPMEWEPLDPLTKHHTWGHKQLSKVQCLNTLLLMLLKLDTWRSEQLNGILCIHVFPAKDSMSSFHKESHWWLWLHLKMRKVVLLCLQHAHKTRIMDWCFVVKNECHSSLTTKCNAYVRLNLKLNCHVDVPGGYLPSSFINVRPSWMIFNKSTLHRNSWYW